MFNNLNINISGSFYNHDQLTTNDIIYTLLIEYIENDVSRYNKLLSYNNNATDINFEIVNFNEYTDDMITKYKNDIILNHYINNNPYHCLDYLICCIETFDISNDPIFNQLLSYQIPHVLQLYETIQHENCIIDASDTGTGKTYMTLVLAKILNYKPFIICPKSVIYNWSSVANNLNIELLGISNYESIKSSKYYYNNILTRCNYIKKNDIESFDVNFPDNTLIVFDEAHRCKNYESQTSNLLVAIKKNIKKNKIILLSATITDKIKCFRPFGILFGFYNNIDQFKQWICNKSKNSENKNHGFIINKEIFPRFGSRIKIRELGDLFPNNQIIAQSYNCINVDEINEQYNLIIRAFEEYKLKQANAKCPLTVILYARMKIELYKIPIMIDIVEDAIESNYSVVIFVCFKETLNKLAAHFNTTCLIYGGQTIDERINNIDNFQNNRSNIIISMISAGGVGISLHDLHGNHPRISVINPSWNSIELKQSLGRIHRAGSQSAALQKIIYCANTCEDKICEIINEKLKNIDTINDGDLVKTEILNELLQQNIDLTFEKIEQ